MIELHVTDEQGKSTSVRVGTGSYLIGRGPHCQIRFPKRCRLASRQHARLTVAEGGVQVEDLDSVTGTMVNGQVVRSAPLQHLDVVSIAGFSLKVLLPDADAEARSRVLDVVSALPGSETTATIESLEADLDALRRVSERLLRAVGTRIIGQERILRSIWATILARGHCFLVGVPGLAKTLIVSTFAEALGLQSRRIQFTPDLLPSDIIGSNVIHEAEDGRRHFEFVQGPIFTQLLLGDEINRTPPKTQAALLEAMQERQVTVANRSLSLPDPFFVIATQNPIEQEGTYPLPEAQLDRFTLCLRLDYPDRDEEVDILLETTLGHAADVEEVISHEEILRFQDLVNQISVGREVAAYAADLVRATRPSDRKSAEWLREVVDWGAGPRAGQALIRIAKAVAAMAGRPAISSQDIALVYDPVLRHRISCNFRARAEGLDETAILARVLAEVPEP